MFKKLFYALTLLVCLTGAAHAQPPRTSVERQRQPPGADVSGQQQEPAAFGSPAEEVRQRALIRHEESSHKEMMERAKEAAQLGTELRAAFDRNKSLDRDDLKKLERMEKLVRKIRSRAGGSEDEENLKNPPAQLPDALSRLETLSDELNQGVQKTSRLVVSAAVIEDSNELIELIRFVRSFVQK